MHISDADLDLWIKAQNDRLRINIDAFTKIFSFVYKCLKLGLLLMNHSKLEEFL